jgi:hypothetical protein
MVGGFPLRAFGPVATGAGLLSDVARRRFRRAWSGTVFDQQESEKAERQRSRQEPHGNEIPIPEHQSMLRKLDSLQGKGQPEVTF